ncbi:DUF1902 domain-containing protein [Enterovirga rhinocerotis]|uniref:Uncharacterized protein DUF1902 n=1 Tax=Enterovirga rhinocerotis TaxID=1339210 RepID=A0A4R7C8I7_9HYPH|nr:DUF1902 domain-containing protein [Enterovirga rhinocerotis]TDR93625.1 uncharacterized protein DUF1902 [Enterovirga rhinocerotis]
MSHKSPLRAERGEEIIRIGDHAVVAAYDPDGEVWFVRTSSVPGLRAEAPTLDDLVDELPHLIRQAELP